jgi:chromosome segregation ATPase
MDYNKLTKQELLELVIQQQTLKEAVEAKDSEIQKVLKENLELARISKDIKPLKDAVEVKDGEIQKLLKEREELKNKNLELTHISKDIKPLKDAVESKDSEIQKLLKEREELKTKVHESSTLNNDIKTLKDAVETKDAELQKLNYRMADSISNTKKSYENQIINKDLELQELREKVSKIPDIEKLQDALETLSKENKILVRVANAHLGAFRNLMKSIQGTLDNAIELEAIITESLQNKHGGIK